MHMCSCLVNTLLNFAMLHNEKTLKTDLQMFTCFSKIPHRQSRG